MNYDVFITLSYKKHNTYKETVKIEKTYRCNGHKSAMHVVRRFIYDTPELDYKTKLNLYADVTESMMNYDWWKTETNEFKTGIENAWGGLYFRCEIKKA